MAKVKSEIRNLTEEEKREWGIFVSHSSDANRQVEELVAVLDEYEVSSLWDHQIQVGAADFSAEIIDMIEKCLASIFVVSEGALGSQWCNFELGYIKGLGKKIFLYDPEGLLDNRAYRYHFDPDCPGFKDPRELAEAVRREKMFYSLFNNETKDLTDEMFRQRADEYVRPVHVSVHVPGLAGVDPASYQLRVLVVEFGNYTGERYCEGSICSQTKEALDNDLCELTGHTCCLNCEPDRQEFPECIILNHVWDKVDVEGDAIEVILPLHRIMGTTFKLFIDTPYGKTADRLMAILGAAGLNPSHSQSADRNRIYFTLRNNKAQGIYDLKAAFSNNFVCPGALAE